jgi:DNA-binding NarL/FixJ family response regulator
MVRILLADDHDIVRRGIRGLIETRDDWQVCGEATNGLDAVALAVSEAPDIAVIDYSMPGLNGIDVAKQIRPRLPKMQTLIFSEHDGDSLIRDALQAGARGFLLKSDADDHLLDAISALAASRPYFTQRVTQALASSYGDEPSAAVSLTPRELETVQLIAEGLSNKRVAWRLGVSVKTVETHRANAMRKLGTGSTAELVRYAVRNGLVKV